MASRTAARQEPAPQPPEAGAGETRRKAEDRAAVGAAVVHEAVRKEGEEELQRPTAALAWSGLAAGLSMGFSLWTEGLLREHLPDASWRPLIAKLGYTIGFLVVVAGRQQLFTENTLTAVLPVLHRRTAAVLRNMLRLWGVVLLTNLLGAALFAWLLARSGVVEPSLHRTLAEIGREASQWDVVTTLVRAIPAGWLIALIVWLGPAVPQSRLLVVLILAYVVGIAGLPHIIAGSSEVLFLVFTADASLGRYLTGYMVPTLLGNTIGGVVLVAVLNHAQVVAGDRHHGID